MFGFSMSEEQAIMRDTIQSFVKDNILDNAHDMDENGEIDENYLQKAWELGISISPVPEEYGGYGMQHSPIMNAIVLEELASGEMAFAVAATLPSLFIQPLLEMGTDAQKKKYLPECCGESFKPFTLGINEPHFGFDVVNLKTTASKKNGSYILNGKKCFVPFGAESSHMMIAANNNGKNDLFIVSKDNPGLKIGEREKNLGLYCLRTYEIDLDNCEVPAEDLLGGDNGCDFDKVIQKSRVAMSAIGTGISRASFEYSRDYAKERVQFGEPIAHRQAIAFMIAEMAYEVDAMRLMTWQAASRLEAGKDAKRESYLAKFYVGEKTMFVVDSGVQILGGHGFIRDHPVERYYRNGRGIAIIEALAIV
ncbi:MAG: acyl-CoA dehydrogenase family protein [Spirochaetota bacterium]|nr:acyl-CoA dehydrogenase family protein [Spirochaetota bacterium]